jgi:hypothetical protein
MLPKTQTSKSFHGNVIVDEARRDVWNIDYLQALTVFAKFRFIICFNA